MHNITYSKTSLGVPSGGSTMVSDSLGAPDSATAIAIKNALAQPWSLENRPAGTPALSKVEAVNLAASGSIDLINLTGSTPGYVNDIFVAFANPTGVADISGLTNSILDFYYDGSGTPAFSIRLCMLFCAEYMGGSVAPPFNSAYVGASHTGGGTNSASTSVQHAFCGYNKMAIPFTSGMRIAFRNTSSNAMVLFSIIGYQTGLIDSTFTRSRLNISSGSSTTLPVDTVVTMGTSASGTKGRIFGLYQMFDGNGGTGGAIVAGGNQFAPLEGNHRIWVDNANPTIGTTTPTMEWSGTEDYIGQKGYYAAPQAISNSGADALVHAACQSPYVGVTLRSAQSAGLYAGYRFHGSDPIAFSNGFKFTWNCGDSTQAAFTGNAKSSWALFYYTTP